MTFLYLLLHKFDTFNCFCNIVLSFLMILLSNDLNWDFFFDKNFFFDEDFFFDDDFFFHDFLHYFFYNLRLCSYLWFCEFISQQIGNFFVDIFTCFLESANLFNFLL